ncbi:hypothetical protein ACRAR1_29340 [Streptomyces sanyensis]|uniref:hypothetical protein n=1 Tax=Streptomyces sanyensis TaxID=568869 RepID=UPI003D77DB1E
MPLGRSWLNANCIADNGTGKLRLIVDGVIEFATDCPSTEVRHFVNQVNLLDEEKGSFRVEVSPGVRWTVDLQIPD